MQPGRSSRAVAGVVAMLPLGVVLVGSPLMTRSGAGAATRSAPGVGGAFAVTVLAVVAAALVAVLASWLPVRVTRLLLAACAAVSAWGATVVLASRLGAPLWLVVLPAALVGLGWAWGVHRLYAVEDPSRSQLMERIPERDRVRPTGAMEDDECSRLAGPPWGVSIRSPRMRFLALFAAVTFIVGAVLSRGVAPQWWVVALVVGGGLFCLIMVAWSKVAVRVDADGLTITSETLGLQLVQVAPQEVLGVASTEIDPMHWGGWGLRWTGRHTAFVVRGGPGLVVYRSSGRPLALEIPSGSETAEDGAALLRTVAARSQGM